MIRAVGVDFLNARPLWESLKDDPRVDLSLAIPSELARSLAEGEADVGLLPVAAAATMGDLRLLRNIAIGARGKVRSVVLVSDHPLEELDAVALDLSSRTSVVLARILLAQRKLSPRYFGATSKDAVAAVGGKTGAVVIGDPALMIEDRFEYRLDLAEAWHEWTGLPFVFAAWFARAGAVSREDEDVFRVAKQKGLARTNEIAREHAARTGLDEASLRSYLTETLRYDLADEELAGMERFWSEGAKLGLLPQAKPCFDEPRVVSRPSLDTLLSRAADGERLSVAEGVRLIKEGSFFELGLAADAVRKRKHPDGVVTYIVDRNVNYTNVCTTSCRFCAFYRPVGHPEGYVLSREVLGQKLQEVVDAGGVQILLQGGLNPELRIEWYEDLFRWMKSTYGLGLHALSPEEIIHLSQLEDLSIRQVLERLHAAGLDSVPGGGAEILVDRVRRKIAKAKCTSSEWLGVMRVAHQMGLRSSATMMYGTVDTAEDRIQHLVKIRDLQDETGGFTAFFCWDYQHENGTHLTPGDNGTHLYLRQQAVARLMLDWFEKRIKQRPTFPKVPLFDLAESVGALQPGVLLVHLTDARPDELERVARSGAAAVLCPRSNLYIEGRLPPLLAVREAGVAAALGTDSLASNGSLDVLAEAKALADRFPTVPRWELLRMATHHGALALGRKDLGRIAKGTRPGLFFVEGETTDSSAYLLDHLRAPRTRLS